MSYITNVLNTESDELSAVFAALADPTRRAILARLRDGEATVTELAEPFAISLPAISRHLRVLEAAGLIERGRRAQWRTSSLRTAPLESAGEWIDTMRAVWNARFDRLDTHLSRLQHSAPQPNESSTRKDDRNV